MVGAVAVEVGVEGIPPFPDRTRDVLGGCGARDGEECGFEGVELGIGASGFACVGDRLDMARGELARGPRAAGVRECFDLAGDAHAAVGVTTGAARVGDEERRGGSGAVRGPLTRSVELAQATSDFRVEASAGPFQCEELFAHRPVPEVSCGELVDRFVEALNRGIHIGIVANVRSLFNPVRPKKPRKIGVNRAGPFQFSTAR